MTPPLQAFVFILDAAAVTWAAWLMARGLAGNLPGVLERTLAWGLAGLVLVAGAGVLLGAGGGFGQPGFLLVHGLFLAAWAAGRWKNRQEDRQAWRQWREDGRRIFRGPALEAGLAALLLVLATGLVVIAFATEPVVYDALTYRLSRVGHWLQEGRLTGILTDDARLNYMPVVPDLVMAWLLTITPDGFIAAAVAQAWGGLLALGATAGLARLTGLGRPAALGAAGLLLGLANVAPQFTSAYTDLFTTGVLAAAFYLWLAALRRGEGSWLGGGGAGLALGAKGTVLYLAPGLLVAVIWLAWRHRAGRAAWSRTLLGGLLAGVVFVLPTLVRNVQAYGGVWGPEDFVVWHHGRTPDLRGSGEKLRLNLTSALAQLCEPNSQPPWWREAARTAGAAVIRQLPEQDAYAFDGLNRRANLEKIFAVTAPDADVVSTGLLLPGLALGAGVAAWRRRRTGDGATALAWAVVVVTMVLFLHWRVQWHPYLFRFLVLVAPWLVVLVGWWLELLPRGLRAAAWTVAAAASLHGFGAALFDTYQSGWPAVTRPAQSVGFDLFQRWRDWSATLDRPAEPLRPALAMNLPLAAFYRQPSRRIVAPERLSGLMARQADEIVRAGNGWVVVPAAKYLGHEGAVMGRTLLHEGYEQHAFSLAAYRALQPGERPVPMVYRNRLVPAGTEWRREMLVRTWGSTPVRLELFNPGGTAVGYRLQTPVDGVTDSLPPGARLVLEAVLPADRVTLITADFPASGRLELRLLP